MYLRVGITHHPLRMAFLPLVVYSQASPLLPTPLGQMPLCTQASQGAIRLVLTQASQGAIRQVLTQDSLTPLGLQELATRVPLPCPLLSHLPYQQMS